MRAFPALAFFLSVFPGLQLRAEIASEKTRTIMHGIYSDLQMLLPLSFQQKAFSDEKNRNKILAGLGRLQSHAEALHQHMLQQPIPAFVAESMRRDAQEAERWYARGRYEQSSFVLHHLVENCVSCHSRNPGVQSFVNSKDLTKFIKSEQLAPPERIRVLIATRQFDEALAAIEHYFLAEETDVNELFADGTMTDYLKIAIQVKNDLQHALSALRKLKAERKLPAFAAKILSRWCSDLENLVRNPDANARLSLADIKEQLVDETRNDLVESTSLSFARYIFLATKLQHQLNATTSPVAQAEIYYLLGHIEKIIEHSFWLSETKFYLQAAIDVAQHTPIAERAYLLLEELTIVGFSGSGGTSVPEDAIQWLADLRQKALPTPHAPTN